MLNRSIMADAIIICYVSGASIGWCAVHSTLSRLLSARSVPCKTGLQAYED